MQGVNPNIAEHETGTKRPETILEKIYFFLFIGMMGLWVWFLFKSTAWLFHKLVTFIL